MTRGTLTHTPGGRRSWRKALLLVRSGTDRRGLLGRDPWVRPRRLAVVGGEDNEVAIGIT